MTLQNVIDSTRQIARVAGFALSLTALTPSVYAATPGSSSELKHNSAVSECERPLSQREASEYRGSLDGFTVTAGDCHDKLSGKTDYQWISIERDEPDPVLYFMVRKPTGIVTHLLEVTPGQSLLDPKVYGITRDCAGWEDILGQTIFDDSTSCSSENPEGREILRRGAARFADYFDAAREQTRNSKDAYSIDHTRF